LLNGHGTGTAKGGLVRRRVWQRPVQLERPVEARMLKLDLTRSAGLGLSKALLVTRVTLGSPAAAQGLRVGSTVRSVSGDTVKSLAEFKAAVQAQRDRGEAMSTIEYEAPPPQAAAASTAAAASDDGDDVLTVSEDDDDNADGGRVFLLPKTQPPPLVAPPVPRVGSHSPTKPLSAPKAKPLPAPKAKPATAPPKANAAAGKAATKVGVQPLVVGDAVTWKGSDEDLPSGSVGKVVKLHPADGDAECVFQTPAGPQAFTFMLDRLDRAKVSSKVTGLVEEGVSFVDDPAFRLSAYFADDNSSSGGDDSRPRPVSAEDDEYPTLQQSWPVALPPDDALAEKAPNAIPVAARSSDKEKQVPKKKKSLTAAVFGVLSATKAKKKGKGLS
jgi:hypothetical protein